jgi:type II secretory pathway component GspD/PulD (secretin)
VQGKKKTELVILITPRVIRSAEGAEAAAAARSRLEEQKRGNLLGGRPWLYGTEGERETFRPWN